MKESACCSGSGSPDEPRPRFAGAGGTDDPYSEPERWGVIRARIGAIRTSSPCDDGRRGATCSGRAEWVQRLNTVQGSHELDAGLPPRRRVRHVITAIDKHMKDVVTPAGNFSSWPSRFSTWAGKHVYRRHGRCDGPRAVGRGGRLPTPGCRSSSLSETGRDDDGNELATAIQYGVNRIFSFPTTMRTAPFMHRGEGLSRAVTSTDW